jgi:hypothetical protein
VHHAQARIPAQDKHRNGQHCQDRDSNGQQITSSPSAGTGNVTASELAFAETTSRLTARPAATGNALDAGIGAVFGQRAARAHDTLAAAGQP